MYTNKNIRYMAGFWDLHYQQDTRYLTAFLLTHGVYSSTKLRHNTDGSYGHFVCCVSSKQLKNSMNHYSVLQGE